MEFIKLVTEPAIIIITTIFLVFTWTVLSNYTRIEKNLKSVYEFLSALNKKEITYRFDELNEFMCNNFCTQTIWEDFKKSLIFPEKISSLSQDSHRNLVSDVYLTVDSSYFFNEETLIYSKYNHKFIQIMPTLLTGLGPFFTFLKMAIAFATLDMSEQLLNGAINNLIGNIYIAAFCSVFAVGYSLLFMIVEKLLYNKMCKRYCLLIQKEFIRLFDVCTSEQFLLDLVRETRIQSSNNEKFIKSLPADFAQAVSKSIGELTTPYLENILYSLNRIAENKDKGSGGDVVDKLF